MKSKSILKELADRLINNKDRYEAHYKIKNQFENLCQDKDFIFNSLKDCISKQTFWAKPDNLIFPLHISGDIIISINLFVPIRDGAKNITQDNIHHHGWRLLTTGVISGNGYETINFERNSHEIKKSNHICLKVKEDYKHIIGSSKFLDSRMAHVVFHPKETCATLALWSADKPMINQSFKRFLTPFPAIRKVAATAIHKTGLNNYLGLNPVKGLYFHPEGGKIVETINYNKPFDGNYNEITQCYFKFFEQIGFIKEQHFKNSKQFFNKFALSLYDKLISGNEIEDLGIWGNLRRRFTKNQILLAIDNNK